MGAADPVGRCVGPCGIGVGGPIALCPSWGRQGWRRPHNRIPSPCQPPNRCPPPPQPPNHPIGPTNSCRPTSASLPPDAHPHISPPTTPTSAPLFVPTPTFPPNQHPPPPQPPSHHPPSHHPPSPTPPHPAHPILTPLPTPHRHSPQPPLIPPQDLPNAMNAAEITDKLGLHSLRHRNWYIQATCATSGDGLYEGLDWLANQLKNKK